MTRLLSIKPALPVFFLIMSIVYILFIPSDPEALKLTFKLIPMLTLLLYTYLFLRERNVKQRPPWFVWIGLFFCMLGDGLIGSFVVGLSAFLLGHIWYMNAFFRIRDLTRPRLAMIIPIALYASYFGWRLVNALLDDDKTTLVVPVILYITVIGLMVWSAILSGNKRAIIGSLLFLASDTVLSWNMFVSDISHSGLYIMSTYYAAQWLISSSVKTMRQHLVHSTHHNA
jgi:alkenylglycerophosphocholine hydrolase